MSGRGPLECFAVWRSGLNIADQSWWVALKPLLQADKEYSKPLLWLCHLLQGQWQPVQPADPWSKACCICRLGHWLQQRRDVKQVLEPFELDQLLLQRQSSQHLSNLELHS